MCGVDEESTIDHRDCDRTRVRGNGNAHLSDCCVERDGGCEMWWI